MRKFLGGVAGFTLTLLVVAPKIFSEPEWIDERPNIWVGSYYAELVSHFDFRSTGSDPISDAGWSPYSYWALAHPVAGRIWLGIPLLLAGAPRPSLPYSFTDPSLQGEETRPSQYTLRVTRLASVLGAAIGFGFLAYRLGWMVLVGQIILFAIPHVPVDLARAMLDGPLILGFGVAALAFGSRMFGIACGLAAAMKLTGLMLWPLLFWPRASGGLSRIPLSILTCLSIWTILNPPSWSAGGPVYLIDMLEQRASEYAGQSEVWGNALGVFLPDRYLLPLEMLVIWIGLVVMKRILTPHFTRLIPRQIRGEHAPYLETDS